MQRVKINDLESKEQVLERHFERMAYYHDRVAGLQAHIEELHKRLKDHRKAKALANKRADTAIAALKAVVTKFESHS